jgi:glutathione synthase/RimK-type ligase-like ATP-grasp enzyme
MKKIIYALIDYKDQFGSKSFSTFYRSGMDVELLSKYFSESGYVLELIGFSDVDLRNINWSGRIVIYTSQEDPNYFYKGYIEDIIYALELAGAIVIPSFRFLRANNNKVFMELLRDFSGFDGMKTIYSHHFGCFEDFVKKDLEFIKGKVVFKKPGGATSRGVYSTNNVYSAIKTARRISKTPFCWDDFKDWIRPFIHKGYIRNSKHRKKFIIQNFIPELQNDWKILVFGNKFFIEYRGVRDNDFRASGSGKLFFDDSIYDKIPKGIFKFAERIRDTFNAPHFSLDIGYKNGEFYLFEYQAVYFSSYAQKMSNTYFVKQNDEFVRLLGNFDLEKIYAESTIEFIERKICE